VWAALLPLLMPLLGKLFKSDGAGKEAPLFELIQKLVERFKASTDAANVVQDPFSAMLERFEASVPAGKETEAIKAVQQGLEARAAWRKVVGASGTTNFARQDR